MQAMKFFAVALVVGSSTLTAQTDAAPFQASDFEFLRTKVIETDSAYSVEMTGGYSLYPVVLLLSDTLASQGHIMSFGPWGFFTVDLLAPVVVPMGIAEVDGSGHYMIPRPADLPPSVEGSSLFLKIVSLSYTVAGSPPVYTPYQRFSNTCEFQLHSLPESDFLGGRLDGGLGQGG